MDISVAAKSGAAYLPAQAGVTRAQRKTDAPARTGDEVAVSSAGAVSEERAGATTFPSFAQEFGEITRGYTDAVRGYYAPEHEENLTYDDPAAHIWDKYKNPDSPEFRGELPEDERAWAYDQELDLLGGGNHLQLRNPYAFEDAGGAPTLSSAAAQAARACREQMDRSIGEIFAENGIEIPADASFRLRVDPSDYSIHVSGLEDRELAGEIERALNQGENGKNLYGHLKLTASETGEITYAGGHLSPLDPQWEPDEQALSEVKRQAGPAWARYSETYDPHQQAMNEKILSLDPDSPLNTRQNMDRLSAAVRVGAPEVVAAFRARQQDLGLVINENREVDPDGSIALQTYLRAYAQPAAEARASIAGYYAQAHEENSAYPLTQGLEHIAEKYLRPESGIFRADIPQAQREMAYRQERALLTGGRLTLLDPYALAGAGGVLTAQDAHRSAMQAVLRRMAELRGQ